jgi:hypothetical protein
MIKRSREKHSRPLESWRVDAIEITKDLIQIHSSERSFENVRRERLKLSQFSRDPLRKFLHSRVKRATGTSNHTARKRRVREEKGYGYATVGERALTRGRLGLTGSIYTRREMRGQEQAVGQKSNSLKRYWLVRRDGSVPHWEVVRHSFSSDDHYFNVHI